MIVIFFLYLFFSIAQADCPTPLSSLAVDKKLQDISKAIKAKKIDRFQQQLEELQKSIPCMEKVISIDQASQYHVLQGIYLWIKRKPEEAKSYFSAAKATKSDIQISTKLFPKVHQIHNSLLNAPVLDKHEILKVPEFQSYYFDGKTTAKRPLLRPTIFQAMKKERLVYSSILQPKSPLPDFVQPMGSNSNVVSNSQKKTKSRMSKRLLQISIGAAAVSSLLYAGALITKSQHNTLLEDAEKAQTKNDGSMRTQKNRDKAEDLNSLNGLLFHTSVYLGGASIGLGGASFYLRIRK